MSPQLFEKACEVFQRACKVVSGQRAALLDEACRGDDELRAEVESLLEWDAQCDEPAAVPTATAGPASLRGAPDAPSPEAPDIPDYELLVHLGSGSAGDVWLGRNRIDDQYYAIKVLSGSPSRELEGVREYKGRVAEHPNLLRIEHVGRTGDCCYYVMPLADNARGTAPVLDPRQYEALTLALHRKRQGPLPLGEVLALGRQMLSALGHLHRQGAVHADVKPANIVRVRGQWQLGDHGLVSDPLRGRPHGFTPGYCPPEGPGGPEADLYALGVVLFEVATGCEPGRVDELLAGTLEIPGGEVGGRRLGEVIRRACAAKPSQRFDRATEMARALDAVAQTSPDEAARNGQRPGPRSWRKRWGTWTAAAVLLVAGGLAVILAQSPATGPLRIQAMQVMHYTGKDHPELIGEIGVDSTETRFDDDAVAIHVELSEPAFCYVIALNADGGLQLCYPADEHEAPPLGNVIEAPVGPDGKAMLFGLTDGVGTQAFVVVASREALPPYAQWSRELGELPWRHCETDGVWTSDGGRLERVGGQRGELRPVPGPMPFKETVAALRDAQGIQSVLGIAFPVRPAKAPSQEVPGDPRH